LKVAVDQALMLRGSRDFSDREAYAQFLRDLVRQRNAGRQKRLEEERRQLQPLPPRGQPSQTRFKVTVNAGSLIRVQKNTYSVHSRLIGEEVEVRLHADSVAVWYAQQEVERLPRLRGSGKHRINYRHLIDWLVRKPGAFENYRYRDDLFPTSRFRLAYDLLRQTHVAHVAAREYLAILQLAARDSEVEVDDALRILLDQEQPLSASAVQQRMRSMDAVPAATEVAITPPNLLMFDDLFHHKEAWHDHEHGCEDELDRVST
jgi:hypothetical protein